MKNCITLKFYLTIIEHECLCASKDIYRENKSLKFLKSEDNYYSQIPVVGDYVEIDSRLYYVKSRVFCLNNDSAEASKNICKIRLVLADDEACNLWQNELKN